jgi:phytoene dehydrogenase-like protein
LTTAAVLARAGLDVTVLEAHIYPGGCAGTFYHQGFRFDAGATLAGGFYPGGPMDLVAQAAGIEAWPARSNNPALMVHLPDGAPITRWTDGRRWSERQDAFGPTAAPFWQWQERTAEALWNLALRSPPWPPQTIPEGIRLAQAGLSWLKDVSTSNFSSIAPSPFESALTAAGTPDRPDLNRSSLALLPQLAADLVRPVAAHLPETSERLRLFVDAQLLISAQTTSGHANALYGAAALDLPRRGVVHLEGGMGAVAETLAQAVQQQGGQVHYRQKVSRIVLEQGRPVAVETKHRQRQETFPADIVIANLPPWNIASLLADNAPRRLRNLPPKPENGWGAFIVYVGLDDAVAPADFPLHHQIVVREPLAEANTVFLSLSPGWDQSRAGKHQRAMTLSTHTNLDPWWQLHAHDRSAYEALKTVYTERMLAAAEIALPGLRDAASLVLPGTPVTFERFTHRVWGWVGGFPQTNLFQTWGPRLTNRLWMVGDSIFPGQSTAAVALGGLRVARAVLAELGVKAEDYTPARVVSTASLPSAAPRDAA